MAVHAETGGHRVGGSMLNLFTTGSRGSKLNPHIIVPNLHYITIGGALPI
jgi:hypothetical protein